MKIVGLVENTTVDAQLKPKHGLSIYIETPRHKVLFDLGPDETYLQNALKLGIDISDVDTVVLSHGHADHGGGITSFLQANRKAKLYLHKQAFEPYYIKVLIAKVSIGLRSELAGGQRFILTGDNLRIDDELLLFSDVQGQFNTKSNRVLLKKTPNGYVQDDFAHEQNLIITAENKTALFSGCAHRGIANILRGAHKYEPAIDAVFGGFHLYNPATKATEPPEVMEKLARDLAGQEPVFYVCHCTGKKAVHAMAATMGDKLRYFSTGTVLEL